MSPRPPPSPHPLSSWLRRRCKPPNEQMLVSLTSSVIGVWVSSGRRSTHSPPCEQLLAAVGVGAGCLHRRAPSVVIWGCRGPCPVRRPHRPPLSSSPCPPSSRHPAQALVVLPSFSLLLASPIVLGLFVWVSSSPPHRPHRLPSSCCCLSSSSLSFSPSLVVVVPVSSPGPLSTL